MTTDAQLEAAHERHRKGEPITQEWYIQAYLETPERRSKLAISVMGLAQQRHDFIIVKRRYWPERVYSVREHIKHFERIKAALTGEETFDKTRFLALYGDLRALQDEIDAVRLATQPCTPCQNPLDLGSPFHHCTPSSGTAVKPHQS